MSKLVLNSVKEFRERQRTINAKHMTNKSKKYRKIHFAVMVLEATAKKQNVKGNVITQDERRRIMA